MNCEKLNISVYDYYINETLDSPVIEIKNKIEIISNNDIDEDIYKLFEKTEELNDKINFIKSQLLNNKLKKSFSNNLLNIIENIVKSIDVIDEIIILNGFIDNKK
jgi:hypothetical protein